MCSMSAFAPGVHWSVMTRRRVIASKVTGADELARRPRHHGDDVVPALLQPARDLDGLVGADAAGHAEGDQSHGYLENVLMMPACHRFHPARTARARRRRSPAAGRTAGSSIVVDDDVVVLVHGAHFAAARLQPPLNLRFAVLAAAAQPLLEHRERRRQHEDRRRASMPRCRTCRAPCTSITSTTSCPCASTARCRPRTVP